MKNVFAHVFHNVPKVLTEAAVVTLSGKVGIKSIFEAG